MKEELQDDLASASESGKAPQTRLSSAAAGCRIVRKLISADAERARKRSIVQGQIDGNAPYDSDELLRLGQSGRSNVNFRQAEGIIDSRMTSYYELIMEVETFVEVSIKDKFHAELQEGGIDYGDIIAEKFVDMMISWPEFWYNMLLHQQQFVTWGIGNCYWLNELDWRFRAAKVGSFLVPDETKASIGNFEVLCVRDSMRLHELFKYVMDKERTKASKDAGWNVELLKKIISSQVEKSGTDKYNVSDWEALQAAIKDNDLAFGYTDFPEVRFSHLLFAEFDGKISHMIVMEDEAISGEKSSNGKTENWLFRKIGRFDSWQQFTCPFFANIGQGSYHSIRGTGPKIYAHCVINDRMLNQIIDGAIASASILLQPSNDPQKERIRMIRVGALAVMPAGYNVVSHGSFRPDLNGLLGVKSLLDSNLNQNIGLYRPDVTDSEKTPQGQNQNELRLRASKEAKLEKTDINMYYVQWDKLFTEVMRRVLNPGLTDKDPGGKEAKAFIKECVDANVPKDLLKMEKLKVEARRAIGVGSPVMRSIISADILSVSPYFDEKGKDNAVRDYIAARGGQRAVRRYKPGINRNEIPTNDMSIAALENNDLREGSDCEVGVDQPHVIHLQMHLRPMVEMADAYMQGQQIDPEFVHRYFQFALRHCAKHLDLISRDPARQNEYKGLMSIFTELSKVFSTLEQQVNKIAKQRQQQAEEQSAVLQEAQAATQNTDLQVKLAKVQGDLQLRAMKEDGNQRLREMSTLHKMRIKDLLADQQLRINASKGGQS